MAKSGSGSKKVERLVRVSRIKHLNIDQIDDLTNDVMDTIRDRTGLNYDSDDDDVLYETIHSSIKDIVGWKPKW